MGYRGKYQCGRPDAWGNGRKRGGKHMWKRLLEEHPVVFEAFNWAVLVLSVGAFGLALGYFLSVTAVGL